MRNELTDIAVTCFAQIYLKTALSDPGGLCLFALRYLKLHDRDFSVKIQLPYKYPDIILYYLISYHIITSSLQSFCRKRRYGIILMPR